MFSVLGIVPRDQGGERDGRVEESARDAEEGPSSDDQGDIEGEGGSQAAEGRALEDPANDGVGTADSHVEEHVGANELGEGLDQLRALFLGSDICCWIKWRLEKACEGQK